MESCRLSLNTLNPNQYPLIVAQALNLMGVVHYNSSRYDEAISYYEQSARLRERAGDENAAAASFNNLALAYQAKAEYEKALEHYNTSLMLKTKAEQPRGNRGGIPEPRPALRGHAQFQGGGSEVPREPRRMRDARRGARPGDSRVTT